MERNEAIKRIEYLRAVLRENSRRYYVDNAPEISDYDYDHLMYELEDLEKEFPDLITPDSPTLKVGSDLESEGMGENAERAIGHEFAQHPHRYPMLSLSNTYSIEEIEAFSQRADKTLNTDFTYCCELKFDGTAICLNYRKGKLFRALTRGDGVVGDDVTDNVRNIANIPQTLNGSDWPDDFEIRGEILMPYESFYRLNEERALEDEAPFANPRNAASGSLKLQNPSQVAKRGLYCTLYHIPSQISTCATHSEALEQARSWGLPVSDKMRLCKNIDEIEEYISYWDRARKELPYATDGIVIKINELEYQTRLGYTAKSPRWAVAFKFQAERALAKVLSIDYQVGRTGAVTPVANLSPVTLSGTIVKRATLNNADQMALMDIRVSDSVYVEKGGEIIPKITGVELSMRPSDAVPADFPEICPDCGARLVKEEGEARHFCPNADACPKQIQGRLIHFASRKAMNILAGSATMEQFYQMNLAKTPADLYDITLNQLMSLDGWQEKAATRFLSSLSETPEVPFPRVLFALGIRYVGESTAKAIAEHFNDIDSIAAASKEELLDISDVGEVIADTVYSFFRNQEHLKEIERLRARGLQFSMQKRQASSAALEGLSIVISGNFSISREEMKRLIEDNGGKNVSSLSAKTSYLLAGSKPGPEKLKKAAAIGIEVIDEHRFRSMLPGGALPLEMAEDEVPASEEEEELVLF